MGEDWLIVSGDSGTRGTPHHPVGLRRLLPIGAGPLAFIIAGVCTGAAVLPVAAISWGCVCAAVQLGEGHVLDCEIRDVEIEPE